jgi:hypothetical protein
MRRGACTFFITRDDLGKWLRENGGAYVLCCGRPRGKGQQPRIAAVVAPGLKDWLGIGCYGDEAFGMHLVDSLGP